MSREVGTEAPVPAASPSVWTPNRTVQIGTCQNKQAILAALGAADCFVETWAWSMLSQVKYSPEVRRINLVWPKLYDLGLRLCVRYKVEEVHNRGLELGLELCEWEDGPQLAAQYRDQPFGEQIHMAMQPIVNLTGSHWMFEVKCGGWGRELGGVLGGLDRGGFDMDARFAFRTDAPAASSSVWTPNREIQIGTRKDKQAMRAALKAAGRQVIERAGGMLWQVEYSPEVRRISLVWPSVSELGVGERPGVTTVQEIHNRGLERGLELCEWEDGPQLAAQYLDQPIGEQIHMAMKPILDFRGYLCLFVVGHDDSGRWLNSRCGMPVNAYHGRDRFAFRCK